MNIFVFGSNLAGRHGKGSAKDAARNYGAEYGVGVGRTGNAYAIPTKDENLEILPIDDIGSHIWTFVDYAYEHPELEFQIVDVGCGLAGYKAEQVAPFFRDAPSNCNFLGRFQSILDSYEESV
jgi:hypothetical protein